MSRPIKFRAWDNKAKAMGGAFTLEDASYEGFPRPITDDNGECDLKADYELMQFTGLTDKNGREVFEGDNLLVVDDVIVETIGGYPRKEPEGRIEPVEFKDGSFWWGEELLWEVAKHGEVISNIYENEG